MTLEDFCERYVDDRIGDQFDSHTVLYGGIDTFLSSWGPPAANGVKSRAYWACRPEHCDRVRAWVRGRCEFRGLREGQPRFNRGDYVHIYVVGDDHPALKGD